ncbi:hypothetical protein ACHFJ0_04890 [Paracoccus sp. NGMCC 1.201697]|uniref:Uncharacterized protein n=1 Tax=Paracoccus broussonetiae subsp. drimophilus TaxID=3373869 RepID=A0ABW7LKT8_9RHOB
MKLPRLVLPWAKTSELSANSRLHWRVRHGKVKAQKRTADALAREARWHMARIPADAVVKIHLTYCPPSVGGTPDDDNVISAQKGALDALATVLGVNDRQFRIQAPSRGERCKAGAVIIDAEVCA